jgi:hypothetical protein
VIQIVNATEPNVEYAGMTAHGLPEDIVGSKQLMVDITADDLSII